MKTNLLKLYIAAFYFCATFVMVAQPGTGSSNGGIDDAGASDTTPAAPIDDYLWVVVLIGLGFAFYKLVSVYKQEAK